jgi:transaldolase/glucose-6-phosphate isomerase
VLGMGGSSLGPEVLAETFARKSGFPKLHVLDSTDPAQVRATEAKIDIANTVFIVSSKSGGTTEPNAMKDYFYDRVTEAVGPSAKTGHRFIAVTDRGSSLEKAAKKLDYARIFYGEPSIGGRYSVLSPFGLVPAATAGIDVGSFIKHALAMVRSCGPDVPPHENPGVQLGLAMGLAGLEGRDKVTIFSSKKIADFGAWAEQLIAESTGKEGKGLIPIDGEPLGDPSLYGNDRFFIDIRTESEADAAHEEKLAALERAGHPVVRIVMKSIDHLGQEFFRFEMATAVAGSILGINPFDQPDVEAAKIKTRELTAAFEKTGALPQEVPVVSTAEADLFTDGANAAALRAAGANGDLTSWLKAHLDRSEPGDYVALLGYIARDKSTIEALQGMRTAVLERRQVATAAEFGPRFLHSTGQAYKGGPDSGVFLQITVDDAKDLPVPGQKATFGVIKAAQARGDFDVLTERGRRALRVHLKGGLKKGLAALNAAITQALN